MRPSSTASSLADATASDAALRRFLHGLPGVDQVGAEQRAAGLSTRSVKTTAKEWALDLAVRMVDLTTLEENDLPNLTVAVMPRTRKVTLVTMETRLHVDRFRDIFELACAAGQTIHKEMKRAVKDRTVALVGAMDAGAKHPLADPDAMMEDR